MVEVLSPGDRPGETLAKAGDWLGVYRSVGTESTLTERESHDGEDVVPEFACLVRSIL